MSYVGSRASGIEAGYALAGDISHGLIWSSKVHCISSECSRPAMLKWESNINHVLAVNMVTKPTFSRRSYARYQH